MDEREREKRTTRHTALLGWENSVVTPMFHFSFNLNIFRFDVESCSIVATKLLKVWC